MIRFIVLTHDINLVLYCSKLFLQHLYLICKHQIYFFSTDFKNIGTIITLRILRLQNVQDKSLSFFTLFISMISIIIIYTLSINRLSSFLEQENKISSVGD